MYALASHSSGMLECVSYLSENARYARAYGPNRRMSWERWSLGSKFTHSALQCAPEHCWHGFGSKYREIANLRPGQTPLHFAAASGSYGCVQHLLDCEADPRIRDDHGSLAADVATAAGFPSIERLLKRAEVSRA